MRSNYWAFKMFASSIWGHSKEMSLAIGGSNVFKNQTRKILSSSLILHKLWCRLHSWMWSVMWVVVFWWQDSNISTASSNLMGSWEYCGNIKAKELKSGYLDCGISMYHLDTTHMRVRWNSLSLVKSSTMLFDAHHRWNAIIWFWGHSPSFPSNLGMFEGILVGMVG